MGDFERKVHRSYFPPHAARRYEAPRAFAVIAAAGRHRRRRRRQLGDVGQDVARQVCQGDRALVGIGFLLCPEAWASIFAQAARGRRGILPRGGSRGVSNLLISPPRRQAVLQPICAQARTNE